MNNTPSPTPNNGQGNPKKTMKQPKQRGSAGKIFFLLLLVAAAIALFVWAEQERRQLAGELEETTQKLEEIQRSTEGESAGAAQEVLSKVRSHIDVPTDPEPTVATIVDVERLRESSDFYLKAKNGDRLVITENRAILYDPERDIIVDVVPVRIDNSAPEGASPVPSGEEVGGSPTPTQSPGVGASTPSPSPQAEDTTLESNSTTTTE